MTTTKPVRRWAGAWTATAAATVLLLLPPPAPQADPATTHPVDKLGHFALFLALGWIWRRALAGGAPAGGRLRIGLFAALVAYGVAIEALQGAGGVRTFDWFDLLADAAGAGLVLALAASSPAAAPADQEPVTEVDSR
jgi:VanZ family protein